MDIYTIIKQKLELKKKVSPERLTRQQVKFFLTTLLSINRKWNIIDKTTL